MADPIHPPQSAIDDQRQIAAEYAGALRIGLLAVLALACAIPFALNVVDPDLWGHVRYGQDWLAAGEMPRTATHTFTAEGYPWINHENTFELAVAWGYEHWGIYPLLVLKCLLGVGVMWSAVWVAGRHGVPALSAWTLMVLVASSLQAFFPLRPQLFSFALCAGMFVCLDRAFASWFADRRVRWAWLTPLPAIMAVWVNSHGGFVAGLCILAAYFGGRSVEAVCADGLRESWRTIAGFAVVGLASLAATGLNPYGLELHRWMAYAMWTPQPEITEWLPAEFDNPVFIPFMTLIAVAVASLALSQKRRDWTQIVILLLVGWQAASHLRHIAFFAMCCAFWLPVHWQSAIERLLPSRPWRLSQRLPDAGMRLVLQAAILCMVAVESTALAFRLSDFPVLRSSYPVDALQYMIDQRVNGKLVVSFNWAQYALSALAPEVTVGFDGRFDTCYPDEVIDMHFDFLLGEYDGNRHRNPASGPLDRTKVLEHGTPDLVLVDRRYPDPVAVMQDQAQEDKPEWSLLYSDSIAQLWGRSSRYDDPQSVHYLPPELRRLNVRLLQARFQWPALPDRSLWDEQEIVSSPLPTERHGF